MLPKCAALEEHSTTSVRNAVLVQAAITNCYRLSDLNNKHLFLSVPEADKSKIKVPVDPVHGEGAHLGLQVAIFLYLHMAESREREEASSCVSS